MKKNNKKSFHTTKEQCTSVKNYHIVKIEHVVWRKTHMNTNEEFIQSFNRIEKYLKQGSDNQGHSTFYNLLDSNSKKNKIIKRHKSELRVLADLRNIIVHGDIESPVAVTSIGSLNKIKFIEKQLLNPPTIKDVFNKNIQEVNIKTSLVDVLYYIKKHGYSQFPVIKDNILIGLITENGITNWLSRNIDEDIVSIKETTVYDVIINDEERHSFDILCTKNTLYEVIEIFENNRKKFNRIYSVIVLNSPKNEIQIEDIYTIITPWDLDLIYRNIDIES